MIAEVDTRPIRERAWDALPGSTPKAMHRHRSGECLWPIGDHHPALFCCLPVAPGRAYCPEHQAIGVRVIVAPAPNRSKREKLRA